MKPMLEVKNLSKKYAIGERLPYYSLRDTIMGVVRDPFGLIKARIVNPAGLKDDNFWALKNISFSVMPGEVIGIIGRNGAGKSTLLKIITQITYPTLGEVRLRGRVSSLLEVGTGFHPELTGRENIYLNGAILGMRRHETKSKFKKIVAFSGIEKFIDTPVKFYSSGMYTRLAFAVAAHLESDILLVDEVLAVGDAEFQKKCLSRMENIRKHGRTILFVSHSMQAITRLCDRVILFDSGRLVEDGETQKVIGRYLGKALTTRAVRTWTDLGGAPGNEVVRLKEVRVKREDGKISQRFDIRRPIELEIEYVVMISGTLLVPAISVINDQGIVVFSSNCTEHKWNIAPRKKGTYISSATIPGNLISDGDYAVRVVIGTYKPYQKHISEYDVVRFHVVDVQSIDSARGTYGGYIPGVVRPFLTWETKRI